MSEFVEIGGVVCKRALIQAVVKVDSDFVKVSFKQSHINMREPYESVRDKLLGKPSPDLRGKFADQLVAYFRGKGQNVLAAEVAAFYNSMMLSETEGAG